jgi:hypothetical protein
MAYHEEVYGRAARALGWRYSSAHEGWISETHRDRQNEDPNGWGSYGVAGDAEQACFMDGVETIEQALAAFGSDFSQTF